MLTRATFCALLWATLLLPPPLTATDAVYNGYRLLETQPLSAAQAHALAAAGRSWDFWQSPRGGARAALFASPQQARAVEATLRGLRLEFTERRWTPPTHRGGGGGGGGDGDGRHARGGASSIDFESFLRFDEIVTYVEGLARRFPQLVSLSSLGSSTEGRDIVLLRIAAPGARPKPAIFIDATIHAREWIAPAVALYTVYQLVENYTANGVLLDEVDWYVLPVLNPDGYEYTFTNERFWRKTRSQTPGADCVGTDANRNFNFHWEDNTGGVCSETYAGVTPFSEPESAALAKFLLKNNDTISLYLTLHSYGKYLLTPWGYTSDMPEDADELVELANKAAAALEAVRGTRYTVGSSANVLYKSYGTSRDWARGVAGIKYSYTMELPAGGSGFDPPPDDILPVSLETFEAIRVFADAVAATDKRWRR